MNVPCTIYTRIAKIVAIFFKNNLEWNSIWSVFKLFCIFQLCPLIDFPTVSTDWFSSCVHWLIFQLCWLIFQLCPLIDFPAASTDWFSNCVDWFSNCVHWLIFQLCPLCPLIFQLSPLIDFPTVSTDFPTVSTDFPTVPTDWFLRQIWGWMDAVMVQHLTSHKTSPPGPNTQFKEAQIIQNLIKQIVQN